jgi:7-cyano-7-deazaguanine synthase
LEKEVAIIPIFFDYGQHCVEKEWETLKRVLPKGRGLHPIRVNISDIYQGSRSRLISEPDLWTEDVEDEELYIPYRTLLFFSIGAAMAQSRELVDVYSGFINSNHAKELDCAAAFLNNLDALAANVGPVRFHIPFRDWSKTEVAQEARRLGVPIGLTYSCQLFSDIPCGACPNCVERLHAIVRMEGTT